VGVVVVIDVFVVLDRLVAATLAVLVLIERVFRVDVGDAHADSFRDGPDLPSSAADSWTWARASVITCVT
jgi:hypothetical protein